MTLLELSLRTRTFTLPDEGSVILFDHVIRAATTGPYADLPPLEWIHDH
ncbi:hypothetical protein OG417_15960 [Actinoallomurus sp. NBC_01490]|jgi:hypothetical protein|nr:hypothetical protein [Actinoallomurus sp. NBC_01490]